MEVATARKCKLLVNNPFELYDLESSYGYSDHNQTMYVALHVPRVEEGQELGLFKNAEVLVLCLKTH